LKPKPVPKELALNVIALKRLEGSYLVTELISIGKPSSLPPKWISNFSSADLLGGRLLQEWQQVNRFTQPTVSNADAQLLYQLDTAYASFNTSGLYHVIPMTSKQVYLMRLLKG